MADLTRGEFLYQLDQFVSSYEDAGMKFSEIVNAMQEYMEIQEELVDEL
jgi:hypothetical protein